MPIRPTTPATNLATSIPNGLHVQLIYRMFNLVILGVEGGLGITDDPLVS